MSSGSPIRRHSDAEEEESPLQQSVQGEHPAMADMEAEDNMSEAKEEMAGENLEDPTDKEADGEAKE
jgi:hypothetical protein